MDDENIPHPVYFSTVLDSDDEAKIPEIVRAKIDVLRILDKDGKVIGGDRIDHYAVMKPAAECVPRNVRKTFCKVLIGNLRNLARRSTDR